MGQGRFDGQADPITPEPHTRRRPLNYGYTAAGPRSPLACGEVGCASPASWCSRRRPV